MHSGGICMPERVHNKRVIFRLPEADKRALQRTANHYGITLTALIKLALRPWRDAAGS